MTKKEPDLTKEEKKLLKKREEIKESRPDFQRQESWRYDRVKESWRRPRGTDSKMRKEKKGWPEKVKVGYRSPRKVRGLHPSGFEEVLVHNPDEVEDVDPSREAIRISSKVGSRKRQKILEEADAKDIKVLNR